MPIVICIFCKFVGQGKTLEEKWENVETHEKEVHPEESKALRS